MTTFKDFNVDDLKDLIEHAHNIEDGAGLLTAMVIHSTWSQNEANDWLLTIKDMLEGADEQLWLMINSLNRRKK